MIRILSFILLAHLASGFTQVTQIPGGIFQGNSFFWNTRHNELPLPKLAYHATRAAAITSTFSDSRDLSQTVNNEPQVGGEEESIEHVDMVICGGGPTGLLSAIMLAQKYPQRSVRLFDRLSAPPSPDDETVWGQVAKFYLIGLGGRGQSALKLFGVWDEVQQRCVAVLGRKDWAPDSEEGVERIFDPKEKLVTTQILPRDKLVGVLHEHIVNNYADRIELNYGYEVHPVDFDYRTSSLSSSPKVKIQVAKCSDEVARLNPSSVKTATEEQIDVLCDTDAAVTITTDLLIAADGTVRTVANAIEESDKKRFATMNPLQRLMSGKPFKVRRYVDDNQRIYKTVPFKIPDDWRPDLNYSARTKDGRVNFDALPANGRGEYCGVLLLKKGDPLAEANSDPAELRELMDRVLPQFSALLDDETIETVAKKPVSYLPGFRYAGPRLHQGDRCLILGDCAHTVKPYFGLGANSALEDVQILSGILDEENDDFTAAVHAYSKKQAAQAKALVRLSRELDRPGKVGFITFILPIILDSIFSKEFPKLFRPNVITMLQREAYSFTQVARRKRFDRLGQVGIIGGSIYAAYWCFKKSIQVVAQLLGKSASFVSFSLILALVGLTLLKRFAARFLVSGLSPADVVTRTSEQSTSEIP